MKINIKKICQNCEFCGLSDDSERVCFNDYSPRCGDEVDSFDSCGNFENADIAVQNEILDF